MDFSSLYVPRQTIEGYVRLSGATFAGGQLVAKVFLLLLLGAKFAFAAPQA